jgi:hypothetical protein
MVRLRLAAARAHPLADVVQLQIGVAIAREQYISRLYNYNYAISWFALWASLRRASRNISEENKHGGRKPTPFDT